jgi:SAM-dependent methyltransferase
VSSAHWDTIYRRRATEDLGWYEPKPSTLELILGHSQPSDAIIDVGSGDSRMVDELLNAGYEAITALDLSEAALERVRSRIGSASRDVTWIRADITKWKPERHWDVWHDRAVFHFLVNAEDRDGYKLAAIQSLPPGGRLIIATFAPNGPERCAGLPVERYDSEALAEIFDPEFQLIEHHPLQDETRVGDTRPYTAAVLKRTK